MMNAVAAAAGTTPEAKALAREGEARERLARVLAQVAAGRELVLGPWHGEVGYETLYWIPFVRSLVATHGIEAERVTAISRGGVASWYAPFAAGYADLLDLVDVEEFRRRTEEGWQRAGGQKQDVVRKWDVELVRRALGPRRARRAALLHPSVFIGLFSRFWKAGLPLGDVLGRLRYERWRAPDDPGLAARLPREYVAVRFYFSPPFPETPENRAFVSRAVAALAARTDVVLLHTGLPVDDHDEVEPERGARVHRPLSAAAPADNLRLQSAILGRASGFVGTYGGFSYLAATYGVPTVALASNPESFFPSHLELARRLALATGAPFTFLETGALDVVSLLVAATREGATTR